jgi:site-specific recombinase XerD
MSCDSIGHSPALTFEDTLADYRTAHMAACTFAVRTREEYARDLGEFVGFVAEHCGLHSPSAVDRSHLAAYLAYLGQRGLKRSTRRRKVAAVRSLFGFLHRSGSIAADPALRLIPPQRERHEPRVLTEPESQRLQRASAAVPRDAALIMLVSETGMRVSEVAALRLADLLLPSPRGREGAGSVRIHGRGHKQRALTLNAAAAHALRSYLAARPRVATDRVFVSKFRTPLTVRAIRTIVKKHLAAAGIVADGTSVHTLRHSFATRQLCRGVSLRAVQEALGHASPDSTSIYVPLARRLMGAPPVHAR